MNFCFWGLSVFLQLLLANVQTLSSFVPFVIEQNPALSLMVPFAENTFGAPVILAEPAEPCDNEHTIDQAVILSPEDDWEDALVNHDVAGHVFLLRAGVYQATDKLWLRMGKPDAPLLIKPYNCGAVTLYGSLRPNSYTTIAGLHLEATGISDTKWAIRFDGKNRDPLTTIVLRNNTILGGTIDAIRIDDDVRNVTIQGNHIDGGQDGHDLFITSSTSSEPEPLLPNNILITQNRLTKQYFSSPSEDMFQVRDVGMITFTYNTCANGYDMEQCVDIKTTTVPLIISHNLFDGATLHQAGMGEDGSGGCMVIHESDATADTHLIEHNYFRHCQGTVIRFAPGNDDTQSSALFRYNLLVQQPNESPIIPLEAAINVQFEYNTMLYGALKLGNSAQSRLPQNLSFAHNIFYQTTIEDNMLPPAFAYTCQYNLLYAITGTGFATTPCEHSITTDPRFVSVPFENLYLQPGSPALGGGENGATLGALPISSDENIAVHHLYLPLILNR